MPKSRFFMYLSVLINVILFIVVLVQNSKLKRKSVLKEINNLQLSADNNVTSHLNFDSIFFQKNDTVYNKIWSQAFENTPEEAFLISCSYFLITKKSEVLDDIFVSGQQLEEMYHKKLAIQLDSSTSK